ncbi:MAG: SPOR domain-containing protein [Candidatus Omnitrophica bacterium]|nr:SPOR domain-containing protein [Candidatus Omnitrophota bacterium]
MKKEIQIDLFSEEIQKSKRKNYYPSLKKLFPYGFVSIRLSYEGLIFSLIVFMLICVVIFSLGVERGKHIKLLKGNTETIMNEVFLKPPLQKRYTIQIASYRDKESAVNLIKELMRSGYKPFVIHTKNLYQVCLGKYPNQEIARELLYELVKKYRNSYLRTIP